MIYNVHSYESVVWFACPLWPICLGEGGSSFCPPTLTLPLSKWYYASKQLVLVYKHTKSSSVASSVASHSVASRLSLRKGPCNIRVFYDVN